MAILLAAVLSRPTSAGTVDEPWYASEGCWTFGETFHSGAEIRSLTAAVAFSYVPCNWVYLQGEYYTHPTWSGAVGAGWSYQPATGGDDYIMPSGATIAQFLHSACHPGGPCANARYEDSLHQ